MSTVVITSTPDLVEKLRESNLIGRDERPEVVANARSTSLRDRHIITDEPQQPLDVLMPSRSITVVTVTANGEIEIDVSMRMVSHIRIRSTDRFSQVQLTDIAPVQLKLNTATLAKDHQ